MNYSKTKKKFVVEFIKRTKENIKIIQDNNGYDITQMINSLIGVLIIPFELWESRVIDLRDCMPDCLETMEAYLASGCDDFMHFFRHLRNAAAHNGITFDGKMSIETITFQSRVDPNNSSELYTSVFKVNEFILFVNEFTDKICRIVK